MTVHGSCLGRDAQSVLVTSFWYCRHIWKKILILMRHFPQLDYGYGCETTPHKQKHNNVRLWCCCISSLLTNTPPLGVFVMCLFDFCLRTAALYVYCDVCMYVCMYVYMYAAYINVCTYRYIYMHIAYDVRIYVQLYIWVDFELRLSVYTHVHMILPMELKRVCLCA